jgi:polar amino acid transport system substrate-binding protein
MIFFRIFVLLSVFLFQGCARSNAKPKIGIDSSWEGMDFGKQVSHVNGFVDELLLEIAHHEEMEFEKIPANPDSLLSGLKEKKYDAVISALPRYTFNLAKFDFSQNFLDLGPVLIVPMHAKYKKISQIKDGVVGVISGDNYPSILNEYPDIRVREYMSPPDLLNGLRDKEVSAALLDRIQADRYVADLYAGEVKIVSAPFGDLGLHLVVEKGEQRDLLKSFDRSLQYLKKKKKIKNLVKKWEL